MADHSKEFTNSGHSKKPTLEVDRLKPRHLKRKSDSSSSEIDQQQTEAKVSKNEVKTEYRKLRKLVPALHERKDITKVEIIEETIRYIDALHHQLASRLHTDSDRSQGNSSTSSGNHSTAASSRREGEPLRSIDSSCGDATVSRTDHPSTQPDASPSTASHSGDDTKALKEAVENIQKLFSIHLLQQENGDNEDSTDEDGEQPNQSGGSG